MRTRRIGWIASILIATTLLWIILLALSGLGSAGTRPIQETFQIIESQNILYKAVYLNAAFLTLVTVFYMSALYVHFKNISSFWSTISLPFIPVYGLANLVSYLSQVVMIPGLVSLYHAGETQTISLVLLKLTIHTWPGSAVEALNGFAYAVLGIPSIVFPLVWFRGSKILVTAGFLLALSGVLSVIAFIGLILEVGYLTSVSIVGGIVFLLSLLPTAYYFFTRTE